jgi:WD40 repeat protein
MMLRQFSNEINMEKNPLLKLKGHQNSVECVTYLNSSRLASGDHDGAVCLWDLETGKQLQRLPIYKEIGIWACESQASFMNRKGSSSSNKNILVIGSSEHFIDIIDTRQGIPYFSF